MPGSSVKEQASVYSVLNLKNAGFNSAILMNSQPVDMAALEKEFEQYLHAILREIFSASTVFSQTEFPERCRICAFRDLCRKG
jgi:CRISPR/Cas system-associated exonuclease Cas4 (RecB family)